MAPCVSPHIIEYGDDSETFDVQLNQTTPSAVHPECLSEKASMAPVPGFTAAGELAVSSARILYVPWRTGNENLGSDFT